MCRADSSTMKENILSSPDLDLDLDVDLDLEPGHSGHHDDAVAIVEAVVVVAVVDFVTSHSSSHPRRHAWKEERKHCQILSSNMSQFQHLWCLFLRPTVLVTLFDCSFALSSDMEYHFTLLRDQYW